jgi:hypothetical protein
MPATTVIESPPRGRRGIRDQHHSLLQAACPNPSATAPTGRVFWAAHAAVPADQAIVGHAHDSSIRAGRVGDRDLGVNLEDLFILVEYVQADLHALIGDRPADLSFQC